MLRWLFLLPVVYGTNIVFDSVSNLGNSPTHLREDPTDTYSMILNGKSFVLARGNGSVWTSNDAGKHFVRTPSVAAPVPSCPLNLSSRASIGHVGYLTEPATNFTFNASTVWTATGTGIHSVPEEGRPVHWVGLPFQTLLFSIESGGVTALPDGTLIATVVTWPAPSPPSPSPYPTPPGPCCNGTVVVYASTDQGMTWQFRAVVADKASVGTEEGPNENNIVTLKDGKTLWLIIRVDGGDGVPDHPHVPYMVTTSTDGGFTWTKLTSLPPELMSAKPKATVLSPIGALVVSGGRPALNLWVSLDGTSQYTPPCHQSPLRRRRTR
mmetsp:Transcript_64318/g.140021  ORF Transcript_64318/g.140021 Transcript_64318/m.140021 type:complete len:324 (-) Transcript_64318:320-1291(-)